MRTIPISPSDLFNRIDAANETPGEWAGSEHFSNPCRRIVIRVFANLGVAYKGSHGRADLNRYAALHAQIYGETVDAVMLIPHMLETFMARDRGFKRGRGDDNRRSPHAVTPKG